MRTLGETHLTAEHEGKCHTLKFQVVDCTNKPLLSAEASERMGPLKFNFTSLERVNMVKNMADLPLTKEKILSSYEDVFDGLGHISNSSLVTDDNIKPIQHTPRCVPVALCDEVKDKLSDLEKRGIIQKVTQPTEWISSMVVVAKPGKIRICLDPRDLNKALKRPKYQMPTLEELLPKLGKAKVFSTLDAKDEFYQIALDKESSMKTAFWTPYGRYCYKRMPFGISVAPEEFECKLQEKLADLPGVVVARDDILVMGYGDSQEEAVKDHDDNLVKLLQRARQANLKLNKSKMNLRKPEV